MSHVNVWNVSACNGRVLTDCWSSPRDVVSRGAARSPSASSRGCWGPWPCWLPCRRTTWWLPHCGRPCHRSDPSVTNPLQPSLPATLEATRDVPSPPALRTAAGTRHCSPGRRQRTTSAALLSQLRAGGGRGRRARAVGVCTHQLGLREGDGSVDYRAAVAGCDVEGVCERERQ